MPLKKILYILYLPNFIINYMCITVIIKILDENWYKYKYNWLTPKNAASVFKEWDSTDSNHCRCSIANSCPVLCDPMHCRLPHPSPTPGACSNSCPSSQWCHPTISSSVIPFSSCLQSFPASRSFQMSQLFASGGQRIGVSASTSVLPMNIQDWFPLGWTGLIPL